MSNNPPFLSDELKNQFILRRHEELKSFLKSLKTSDFQEISRIGHRMKGNGVSFGFPELSSLGEKMENSAKEKNLNQLRFLAVDFTNWVDSHPRPASFLGDES
ncbi:MAG: Hpt domain-containing protein [Pseudobdellovibrionaceae bacterium]